MAEFEAFVKGVEVNGQTVLSVVNGMIAKEYARKVLEDNGIIDPKPGSWYSQQNWLDAFRAIAERIGPLALNSIGRKIPESADWPPQVNSIETALASIDVAYHMNHRINGELMYNAVNGAMKEGIGHYGFEKVSGREIKMVCENPYPCEFDKGIILAAANKFKPTDVSVILIAKEIGSCRKKGERSCTYVIRW